MDRWSPSASASSGRSDRPIRCPSVTRRGRISSPKTTIGEGVVAQSYVFAGVGGYYGTKDKTGKAGIFRRDAAGSDWDYVLKDLEAFTVFVHPRDPSLVFAGTSDGVYRSTDHGATFKRANFPDQGVQVWSFMADPADPRRMLAGGSPVAVYKSADSGE